MIPKTIHYCWFGGNPLPELAQKCIESWKKLCPDYEIIEWNESNFDFSECDYAREAYEAKKWAFVSDYARLKILYDYGGIYMDTDVEVIKPLDSLLHYKAVSGFESETQIPTGLMASVKGMPVIGELLDEYNTIHFKKDDGKLELTTNVIRITNTLLKYGLNQNNSLQTIEGFTLLPKDYLCPKSPETGVVVITDNTLTIHHFDGSWLDKEASFYRNMKVKMAKHTPLIFAQTFALIVTAIKFYGYKWPIYIIYRVKKKMNKI